MDEISLTQKFLNLFLLMGGMYVVFFYLIYGVLRLGVAVLGKSDQDWRASPINSKLEPYRS